MRQGSTKNHLLLGVAVGLLLISASLIFLIVRWNVTGEQPPLVHHILPDAQIDETDVSKQEIVQHQVPAEHPKYIEAPEAGINKSRILAVGVNASNQLESPVNIHDTAWFEDSSTPGSGGAVLINGHNGGYVRDGIFANLRELKTGDLIKLTRGDDKVFNYQVVEARVMSLSEANSHGMAQMMQSAKEGSEGLNLITCDGTYSANLQQFDKRVMVRAVLRDETT